MAARAFSFPFISALLCITVAAHNVAPDRHFVKFGLSLMKDLDKSLWSHILYHSVSVVICCEHITPVFHCLAAYSALNVNNGHVLDLSHILLPEFMRECNVNCKRNRTA